MMDRSVAEEYFDRPPVTEYRWMDVADIPFSEAVLEACRANRCGRYGTCWTCPPGTAGVEERIKSYAHAVVFSCKYDLEDSFDFEGMMDGMKQARDALADIRKNLTRDGIDHMALGCEGCNLCPTCTYPDAPCRHPESATPSVEACGIHVVDLSRKVGVAYNNGPNTVTYFCIVLFNRISS